MYRTGFAELDSIISGLRPGELTAIAGRPGMGTAALCRSITENIRREGKDVILIEQHDGYTETSAKHDVIIFTGSFPKSRVQAAKLFSSLKELAVAKSAAVLIETAILGKIERLHFQNRRPKIEHLKFGKAVEQFIDNLLLVYRAGYYDPEIIDEGMTEVLVVKSSSGKLGTAILWDMKMRIEFALSDSEKANALLHGRGRIESNEEFG